MRRFRYASRSSKGVVHITTAHDDGRIVCTCRGYSTPNRCWHVKRVAELVAPRRRRAS
jgi:hypothetical protein